MLLSLFCSILRDRRREGKREGVPHRAIASIYWPINKRSFRVCGDAILGVDVADAKNRVPTLVCDLF